MQGRIIFLLEEPSLRVLLEACLPRLFPGWVDGQHFQCIPHEGKSDLERSIPRKLAAWRIPGDRFVVVRDNDGADCVQLKERLLATCHAAGRPDALVRLVCQELESWYLGDLSAVASAFGAPRVDTPANRRRFAQPDACHKPSVQVKRLVPAFQKIRGARAMGALLEPGNNRSHSFHVFIEGVHRMAAEMGYEMPVPAQGPQVPE